MCESFCEEYLFQKNANMRILRTVLFSKEEKVRRMYQKKDLLTKYIEEMPLADPSPDGLTVHASFPILKEQYTSYWSKALQLSAEAQKKLSEIWDSGVLEKHSNPDIGRTAIFFPDGRKMTEDNFVSILLETFRL